MLRVALTRRAASAAISSASASSSSSTAASPLALHEQVTAELYSSRYLRHAPPRLYVTCAHDQGLQPASCGRHRTTVLDVSRAVSADAPPHTQCVYLLSSTALADTDFSDAAAQSHVLVGLPQVRHPDAVRRFCDTHAPSLSQVHHIVLPGDVDPMQAPLLAALLERLPQARVACNAFGQALLTNPAFHDGVRRAVLDNAPGVPVELLRFADLPPARVSAVGDGDAIAVDVAASAGDAAGAAAPPPPARTLRVVAVKDEQGEQRRRDRGQTHHPAYFTNQRLYVYDDAFHSLFVGTALQRLPWLPLVLKEAVRDFVLPTPPPLALQHPLGRPNILLDTWRIAETTEATVEALRRLPEVERVLCASYGEMAGHVEDCVAAVERTADALEQLRSRLAHRLASDTGRDVHRWSAAMLKRVVAEVACVQKPSEPTTPAVQAQLLDWAAKDGEWGRLATCLVQSAMVLPPSTPAKLPAATAAGESIAASKSTADAMDGVVTTTPLEGAAGVDLLIAVFEKKGLQGLTRTVQRETIDVQVFLAMSEADLKSVFKATFGITKRLVLLQEELRKNV